VKERPNTEGRREGATTAYKVERCAEDGARVKKKTKYEKESEKNKVCNNQTCKWVHTGAG
jgi:hypothetical protein